MTRRSAFTLIELSIVVFILAVLMAVSVPAFVRSYNSSLLNEAVRNFVTCTQYARIQAVIHQQTAMLHIDLDRQMFWVSQVMRGEDGSSEETTVKVVELPRRVSIFSAQRGEDPHAEKQVAVEFYPNGTCQSVTVVFRGTEKGNSLATEIDPLTTRATTYPVKL
jgi:prepilin-type N-terminal cleavage/methylation domain-containing protein